jgi:hypothetical protein
MIDKNMRHFIFFVEEKTFHFVCYARPTKYTNRADCAFSKNSSIDGP